MLCSQSCEFCMDISCDNKGTYHVASFLCNLVIHGGPMSLLCILFKFKGSFKKNVHVTYDQSPLLSIESHEM